MARAKLGEILIQRGVIDAAQLKRALGEQTRFVGQNLRIGQILVDLQICTWDQVAEALAAQQALPFAALLEVDDAAVALVPVEVCDKWKAVAFHREAGPPEEVQVAFADSGDLVAVDALRLRLGKRLKVFVAAPHRIQAQLDRVFRGVALPDDDVPVELEGELLDDDDGAPMTVEHFEAGSLRMPESQSEVAPSGPSIALASFDALFGDPPPAVGVTRPVSPSPLLGETASSSATDLLGELGIEAPAPLPARRVPVTVFPDKRPREAPPPPQAKPTLVLTTDALFGAEPGPPTEPEPGAREALFDSHFDASEHADHALSELGPEPAAPSGPAAPNAGMPGAPQAPAQEEPGEELSVEVGLDELASEPAAGAVPPPAPLPPPALDLGRMMADASALLPETIAPQAPAAPTNDGANDSSVDDVLAEDLFDIVDEPEAGPDAAPREPAPAVEAVTAPHSMAPEPPAERPASSAPDPLPVSEVPASPARPPSNGIAAAERALASFAERPLTAAELQVIESIEQLADGAIDEPQVKQARPAHMVAALVRLLIRRGIIQEIDFLEELTRK